MNRQINLKHIIRRPLAICIHFCMALLCAAMCSCGEKDPAADGIMIAGVWELAEIDSQPLTQETDIDQYTFRADGQGVYGYYSDKSSLQSWSETSVQFVFDQNDGTLVISGQRGSGRFHAQLLVVQGQFSLQLTNTASGQIKLYRELTSELP